MKVAHILQTRSPAKPAAAAVSAVAEINKELMASPGLDVWLVLADGDDWVGITVWRDAVAHAAVLALGDRGIAATKRAMPEGDPRLRRLLEVASCVGLRDYAPTRSSLAEVTSTFGGDTDTLRQNVATYGPAVVAVEGCEGWLSLVDEASHCAVHLSLWRDRDAYDAFVPARDRMIAEATAGTDTVVSSPTVYRVMQRVVRPDD